MNYNDELLITYGVGYVFKKTKLLGILELEKKYICEEEVNIQKEINFINKLDGDFYEKYNSKFPSNYVETLEDILDDELEIIVPLIVSIKYQDDNVNEHKLMNEYRKHDLMQLRFNKHGYKKRDLNQVKVYLDKKIKNICVLSKDRKQAISDYDKLILKLILMSNKGDEFATFINKNGQEDYKKENHIVEEKQLKNEIKNSVIINKNYNELDFLNLILVLEEWNKKHFTWDGEYTSLMFLIDKNGNRDLAKNKEIEIKDFMISFLKGKRYLYFPFAKYDRKNVLITLNNEKYFKYNEYENLYKISDTQRNLININNNINCISDYLNTDSELGYLLSYKDEMVDICPVNYDKNNKKIVILNREEQFKEEMIEALNKYYIR